MITHEITKPKPPNLYHQAKDTVLRFIGTSPRVRDNSSNQDMFMPKVEFAQWIEEVRKEFPINSLWTFAAIAYVPEKAPTPVMRVVMIEEIHWNAPLGETHKQPRCVYVKNEVVASSRSISYEPKMLRRLHPEELKLVHIRNQASGEAKPETCTIGANGKFQLLDANGNVLKEYT